MNKTKEWYAVVDEWWPRLKGDSGDSATLRRSVDPVSVRMTAPYYNLYETAKKHGLGTWNKNGLAYAAMVLSHIDRDSEQTMAAKMGKKTKDMREVSEFRFQRLISADISEAAPMMIRLLPMIDKTANIGDLTYSILYWDFKTQFIQENWAKHYYLSK